MADDRYATLIMPKWSAPPAPRLTLQEFQDALARPEITDLFGELADHLVKEIARDTSIALPRAGKGGENVISTWMDENREKIEQIFGGSLGDYVDRFERIMLASFGRKAPGQVPYSESTLREYIRQNLWRALLPGFSLIFLQRLHAYVLRKLATRWAARQYPDGIRLREPQPEEYGWRIPILLHESDEEVGRIALDDEGNILPEHTTSRQRFLEALENVA